MRQILIAFSFLLMGLTGCSTTPNKQAFMPATPSSPNMATVYIYRLSTPPYFLKPDIVINSKTVAELPTKTYTVVHLLAGTYEIKTKWDFSSGAILNRATTLTVAPKTVYYVEVFNEMDFIIYHSSIITKALSEPPSAIQSCSLVSPLVVDIKPQ
ncbi:MAG: DUF2846 domain-containing protein [Gallionella sp.]